MYASALSDLGIVMGTSSTDVELSLYLESALISTSTYNATIYNLVADATSPGAGEHDRCTACACA